MIDVVVIEVDRITEVIRGTWNALDARDLAADTRVIGRGHVKLELAGGEVRRVLAVIVAGQRARDLGRKFALFFHPADERLLVVPLSEST